MKPGETNRPDASSTFLPCSGAIEPTAAMEISTKLELPPERFLYLGDTGTDMKTATAAGMFPVGALWGFRTADELKSSGAKVLVDHPREVLDLL